MTIRVNSPQEFKALINREPARAQAWLKELAAHSEGLLSKEQLATLEKVAASKRDAFVKAATDLPLDAMFGAAPVNAVGGNLSADLPVIHGKITVERGTRTVLGEQGYREWPDLQITLTTDDGRTFSLESDHDARSDIFTFIPGTDVMAFDGQEVSLRGFIDEAGKALRVTEFAPGHLDDFTSGRVVVQGDQVFVRTRGRGMIEVTDPKLEAQLKEHGNLGVILEGKTLETQQPDGSVTRQLADGADDYWMLVRFTETLTPSGDGLMKGPIQAATNRTGAEVSLPADEAKHIEGIDRMYVKGHFEGDDVKATKATPSAGSPWLTASSRRAAPMKSVIEFTEAQEPV